MRNQTYRTTQQTTETKTKKIIKTFDQETDRKPETNKKIKKKKRLKQQKNSQTDKEKKIFLGENKNKKKVIHKNRKK